MGRFVKVPVTTDEGNKLVRPQRIGLTADTPYYPDDVREDVLERMGFDGVPTFADGGSR